jgi:hypothetical protein
LEGSEKKMSNKIAAGRSIPARFIPTKTIWALCAAFILTSAPALADNDRREDRRGDSHWNNGYNGKHAGKHHKQARKHHDWRRQHGRPVVIWHGHRRWAPPPQRHFHYHQPRPFQRHYDHGYRRSSHDDWALYAILALQLVDTLNDSQQQSYAWAQQRAVAAPLGEIIEWQDNGAYGSVTAIRDGNDGGGRYCREFQHQITVGNRPQSGYGVACRQPDGAWEIVS